MPTAAPLLRDPAIPVTVPLPIPVPDPAARAPRSIGVVTITAAIACLLGVLLLPGPGACAPLIASVLLDAIDGALHDHADPHGAARRRRDWWLDGGLSIAIIFQFAHDMRWILSACLLFSQILARQHGVRSTGRTLVTSVAAAAALCGWA